MGFGAGGAQQPNRTLALQLYELHTALAEISAPPAAAASTEEEDKPCSSQVASDPFCLRESERLQVHKDPCCELLK